MSQQPHKLNAHEVYDVFASHISGVLRQALCWLISGVLRPGSMGMAWAASVHSIVTAPQQCSPSVSDVVPASCEAVVQRRRFVNDPPEVAYCGMAQQNRDLALTACLVGFAMKRSRQRRRTVLARKAWSPKRIVSSIRNWFGGRESELQIRIREAEQLILDVETKATRIQQGYEVNLSEERKIEEGLLEQLQHVKAAYDTLSTELELEQTQASERMGSLNKTLQTAKGELGEARRKEAALRDRLARLEKENLGMESEAKELERDLQRAAEKEKELESVLLVTEKKKGQLLAELESEKEKVKEKITELNNSEMREKEYKKWLEVIQEDNQQLLGRLQSLQNVEKNEKQLSDKLALARESNKQLDAELKVAEEKLEFLLSKYFEENTA